jgi:hypothetical protein
MNIWTKRLLIVLSVGGGFCGMVVVSSLLPQASGKPISYLLATAMIATFAFGVFAGFRLIEEQDKGLKLLRWFFALQIPILSSPFFVYQLTSGFGLMLWIIEQKPSISWRFGSEMGVCFLQDQSWVAGVNVFALAMFLWTSSMLKKRKNKSLEPPPLRET